MKSGSSQYNLFETLEPTTSSNAPSTETTSSEKTGQTLTEIIEENLEYGVSIPVLDYDYNEQLDFDSIWQEKLRKKYGIRNAID